MSNPFVAYAQSYGVIKILEADLRTGLKHFFQHAAVILEHSPVHLLPPEPSTFSLARNFFSTLFLYSYFRAGIPSERRILYVEINQCLRGMVTGCDNLLDDEYKTTLETDLPRQAHRFRSVLDIMVADRVLFNALHTYCEAHKLPGELALQGCTASLQALTLSGVQEATEEGGIAERLKPDVILEEVHRYKTGMLFQSTWAIPAIFEGEEMAGAQTVQQALYRIGIGCQMLDDIVDLLVDVREQRHNYVASVIVHQEAASLQAAMMSGASANQDVEDFHAANPALFNRMKAEAMAMLEGGLHQLFLAEHQPLAGPAAKFIADRIGVKMNESGR